MPRPRSTAHAACGWTLALALAAAPAAAPAQGQTAAERSTAQIVRAVAAEARQRIARNAPVTEAWNTLDRALLERLLSGTDLATYAGRNEVNLLIDQGGAWDLLHFEKPSDVLASWQRWRPDDPSLRPLAADAKPDVWGHGFYANAPYGDQSGAFMALWRCLPRPAWRVFHTDPMIWAFEQGTGWEVPNTFDFGQCVLAQSEEGGSPFAGAPATERGLRSAAVLERKLSATLRREGCRGRGPDDCLTLLHALVSLAPRHAELPRMFDDLAGQFLQRAPPDLPRELGQRRVSYPSPDWEIAQHARRDFVRQALYIEARMKMWRSRLPTPSPPGEAARTLQRLYELTDVLVSLDGLQQASFPRPRLRSVGRVGDPWGTVELMAAADPQWSQALLALGSSAAATPGCAITDRFIGLDSSLTPGFWLGYALGKLTREGQSCNALARSGLAESYGKDSAAHERLQPLRWLIGNESQARGHNEVVTALGAGCPLGIDPWRVCNWVHDPALKLGDGALLRRLPLRVEDRFVATAPFASSDDPPAPALQLARLLQRVQRLRPRALTAVSARLSELGRWGTVLVGNLWRHPRHQQVAVELELQIDPTAAVEPATVLPAAARTGRVLLVLGETQARLLSLPVGWGQYDDGRVTAISDIDGDLRLEVWFAGEHGECDGDDSRPGVDCSFTLYRLGGEMFGNELSAYRRGHPPASRP